MIQIRQPRLLGNVQKGIAAGFREACVNVCILNEDVIFGQSGVAPDKLARGIRIPVGPVHHIIRPHPVRIVQSGVLPGRADFRQSLQIIRHVNLRLDEAGANGEGLDVFNERRLIQQALLRLRAAGVSVLRQVVPSESGIGAKGAAAQVKRTGLLCQNLHHNPAVVLPGAHPQIHASRVARGGGQVQLQVAATVQLQRQDLSGPVQRRL